MHARLRPLPSLLGSTHAFSLCSDVLSAGVKNTPSLPDLVYIPVSKIYLSLAPPGLPCFPRPFLSFVFFLFSVPLPSPLFPLFPSLCSSLNSAFNLKASHWCHQWFSCRTVWRAVLMLPSVCTTWHSFSSVPSNPDFVLLPVLWVCQAVVVSLTALPCRCLWRALSFTGL